jgi:molybdopterin/thiamine biosynthesis adenylyltransferase
VKKNLSKMFPRRYLRQTALPEVGPEGQVRLKNASVLVVGAGGLGSPALFYLASAGVGRIGIMDPDRVEDTNLHRQVIHRPDDLGKPKARSARARLRRQNPLVRVIAYPEALLRENARRRVRDFDFVIDATDNWKARGHLARACHVEQKPYSYGGVHAFEGQTLTVLPGETACLRCLFRELPREKKRRNPFSGIFPAVPGVIGTLQAGEALKYFVGGLPLLTNRLLTCDLKTMRFREVALSRQPNCPLCGEPGT